MVPNQTAMERCAPVLWNQSCQSPSSRSPASRVDPAYAYRDGKNGCSRTARCLSITVTSESFLHRRCQDCSTQRIQELAGMVLTMSDTQHWANRQSTHCTLWQSCTPGPLQMPMKMSALLVNCRRLQIPKRAGGLTLLSKHVQVLTLVL